MKTVDPPIELFKVQGFFTRSNDFSQDGGYGVFTIYKNDRMFKKYVFNFGFYPMSCCAVPRPMCYFL